MELVSKDRLKNLIDFWFQPGWDRDTPRPTTMTPIWWGYKYEGDKCFALNEADQKLIDDQIRREFEEDLMKVL